MLPEERRRRILAYLAERGSARIGELSRLLGVSTMTVQRDVRALAARGLVRRVRGGVMAVELDKPRPQTEDRCALCRLPTQELRRAMVVSPGRESRAFCCPHCALMWTALHPTKEGVVLVQDFLYGRVVDASQAVYVVGSGVVICCQPSVWPFLTEDEARRFAQGFGGQVMSWAEAQHFIVKH